MINVSNIEPDKKNTNWVSEIPLKKKMVIKKTIEVPQKFEFNASWIDWLDAYDIYDFIQTCFGEQFMNEICVKEIHCENKVYYAYEGMHDFLNIWLIPLDEFTLKYEKSDEKGKIKLLENVFAWNSFCSPWYFTIINVYNQDYVFEVVMAKAWKPLDYAEIEYFAGVDRNDIPKLYKIWTIAHEIWHHIYWNKIEWTNLMSARQNVIDKYWGLTKYAQAYAEKWPLYYNENMWEAIRIFITNRPYLQEHFPDVDSFIVKYFPLLHPYHK